jgi:hypothetical protein
MPQEFVQRQPPALKARFIPAPISVGCDGKPGVKSRFQRLSIIGSESWGDAPGGFENARVALNRYPPGGRRRELAS